jgi:hypothetical protein
VGGGVRSAHFTTCSECKIKLVDLKTVKPELTGTLDELVDVTRQRINKSLELLWAIAQQRKVGPKVKASIESVLLFCDAASDCADICIVLARKVRFEVYFWSCIHHVQGYWQGLSTSLKLTGGGKSLEKWFKVIHRDTITYMHCFFAHFRNLTPISEGSGAFTIL